MNLELGDLKLQKTCRVSASLLILFCTYGTRPGTERFCPGLHIILNRVRCADVQIAKQVFLFWKTEVTKFLQHIPHFKPQYKVAWPPLSLILASKHRSVCMIAELFFHNCLIVLQLILCSEWLLFGQCCTMEKTSVTNPVLLLLFKCHCWCPQTFLISWEWATSANISILNL